MNEAILSNTLPFWGNLTAKERELVLGGAQAVDFTRGQVVHSPLNECIGVLVLQSGELRTYMLSEDGREVTLFRMYGGEICVLSASCILREISFDVYIDAQSDCRAILLPAPLFSALMRSNMQVENFTLRAISDKFSEVMWAMEQILFMSPKRRLAIFLSDELTKSGGDTVSLTHEQIAKYTGSAREVISRTLKHLEKSGIVSLSRGGITVLDKPSLKKLLKE